MSATSVVAIGCFWLLFSATSVVFVSGQDCYQNPSQPSCKNYRMDTTLAQNELNALCSLMKNMPGCTINNLCLSGRASGMYCDPFHNYKLICDGPMYRMSNCSKYKQLCSNVSVVEQCSIDTLPIPDESKLMSDINTLCAQMSMQGCDTCKDEYSCDTLSVYSSICLSMPDMDKQTCSAWSNYCSYISSWPLCSVTAALMPMMQMYFHLGIVDYVLFKEAVPRTPMEYLAALIVIILVAIFYEGVKAGRLALEYRWRHEYFAKRLGTDKQSLLTVQERPAIQFAEFQFGVDTKRALIRMFELFLSYILMLVAMTFNVGLFLAVLFGAFVGNVLFGRFQHPINSNTAPEESAACH